MKQTQPGARPQTLIAHPFTLKDLRHALSAGWQIAQHTRRIGTLYAAVFTLPGALILSVLLLQGISPFILTAAGAFMLIGPATLAGFFGIAEAHAQGQTVTARHILAGFRAAASSVWVIALVCCLLFIIFISDVAILYSYMVGSTPVWLNEIPVEPAAVQRFLLWGMLSGLSIAFMLYCVSAFSVPLLCERRTHLVTAVVTSVRTVFKNFLPAMIWAALLASITITSILLPPLLLLTLPWLAHASRALYRQVFPLI